jgi:hypothetical protein
MVRLDPVGTVITTGDQVGAAGFATDAEFSAEQVAVEAATAEPQTYPHIGNTVPSGSVLVVGAAVRLTCWPRLMTVARRKNAPARSTVLSLVPKLELLIRIIVVASRCRSVVDTQIEFLLFFHRV